jgi:hypothetical protein
MHFLHTSRERGRTGPKFKTLAFSVALLWKSRFLLSNFFDGLECVGHSFAYVAHFVFLRDVWIRTQRAAVASWLATNLATNLPKLSRPSPSA